MTANISRGSDAATGGLLNESSNGSAEHLTARLREILKDLPAYVSRKHGADLLSRYLCTTTEGTVAKWRLPSKRIGREALVPTDTLFAKALAELNAAPVITMGGHSSEDRQAA
jgi:hypothetical protein